QSHTLLSSWNGIAPVQAVRIHGPHKQRTRSLPRFEGVCSYLLLLIGILADAPGTLIAFPLRNELEDRAMIRVEFGVGNAAGRDRRRSVASLEHVVMICDIAAGLPDCIDLQNMIVWRGSLRTGRSAEHLGPVARRLVVHYRLLIARQEILKLAGHDFPVPS